MMNNNLTHLIKNLQLFYYKREMFRFYLIALSFLFVQSLFTMASAEDNIFNNYTIVIKTFIVQNNNDSSIYYVSASDTAQISINTQPLLSSLWIINLSNDTISFKNLLTNRYLATNTAEDSLIQSQVEYKWVLFDDNQKMRSAYNSSYIFSISSSQGYVIDSVSETMNLISYVQDYDTFTLQVDSNYLVLDTIASSSKLTIYSKQKYKYSPSNNSNTNIIIDSIDVAYTCTVSDTSWLTIINDTLHATALPLNTLARNGTVLISVPSKGESDIIAISQWQDLGNVALRHVNGLSGRPLNSRGLQQTSEYVKTIYTMQDSSVTLNLPFHNGGNSMQSYYCWYNYATLETLNSNLELNNNYRAFNNNSGKYCLGYTGNVFTYKAQNVTFPIEIACDGSAYTDYSLSGSNFYEPTISCRFIFIIDDASILAQKIADANASGTSPTGYLENYNMMIPTNQIVRLVTEYNLTGNSATYFAYNKSGQVEIVSNIKLYIDSTESSLVITKNKYVQLYYPKTLGNSTYQIRGTLSDGTIVNIAQYNLDFVTTSTVGPVEVGSSDMLANNYQLMMNYNPISNLWFYDLSHDAPFDPFSLTNLGFCYNTTDRSSYQKTSSTNAFATCFEYQFLTTSTSGYSSNIKQGVTAVDFDPEEDYSGSQLSPGFLYVNPAGNIVDLFMSSFTPPNKDPYTEYFASLYINNLSLNSGQNPQLTFYVEELKDSVYQPVTQYSSGELVMTTGTWYQIGFPFNLSAPVGDNYRIRVENNCADWYTNTYALDQFGIYQKLPVVSANGVYQNCSTLTNKLKSIVVRLDYEDTCMFCDDEDEVGIYYQCTDSLNNIMPLAYNNVAGETNYGYVLVKDLVKETANYPLYTNTNDSTALKKYLATMTTDSLTGAFYSMDTVIDVERYMFYFVFQSYYMDACQDYYIKLFSSSSLADSTMIGSATFVPIGECIYSIEDNVYTNASIGVCPATSTDLTITQQVMVSDTKPVTVNGYYDWLWGTSLDYTSDACYSQYDYNTIISALEALHKDTTYMSTKVLPTTSTASITNAQIELLDSLISDSLLYLYKQRITVALYDSVSNFTVYPYGETMVPDNVTTAMEICNEPWTITLPLKDGAPWLLFGKTDETLVTSGLNYLRQARVSNYAANKSGFVLPIKASSYNTIPTSSIGKMYLKSSNDDSMNSYIGETIFDEVIMRSYSSGSEIVTSYRNSDFPDLKVGYNYVTLIEMTKDSSDCTIGYQQVEIIPQPDTIYWTGAENSSWNNINNWQPGTSEGNIARSSLQNFVPLYLTDVIIANTTNTPTLYDTSSEDTNQTTSLERDLVYIRNECHNLYFAPNASLIGQEYLAYDSVWVDVILPTKQWYIMSPPIRGLVSGDMYVATTSNESSVFSSLDSCNSRYSIPFWQSVYNSYIEVQDYNGTVTVSNAGWSSPANGMNTTFAPRTGFCVWAGNTNYSEDSITLRLPKGDDKYYYYNAGDTPLGMSVSIDRPSDYYKLAFIDETWSNVPTISIFDDSQTLGLTGNPFMTTLYMKPFFAANTTLTGSYWIVKDKTIEACTASGESTTGATSAVNIPPMQGFFVEVESGNEFSPSNLTFTSAMTYPTTTSQSVASSLNQISRLRITALYGNYESKALLIENPLSRTDYYPKEDVPIVVLSESMTPSSLYTVGGNRALQINAMPQIEQVPVVLRLNNTNNYGATFKLTFTGSNSFDGTLLLLDVMTNKTYTITEGTELLLDVPNDQTWRYFITHARTNTELDQTNNNDAIQIFTPETNVAMIVSLKEITKITVFDTTGRLVYENRPENSHQEVVMLQNGIYLFAIENENTREVHSVIIR